MQQIDKEIIEELNKATLKFPFWPNDPFHALSVLGEEYGELQKAVLQFTYEKHKGVTKNDIKEEAIQVAAMAIRWLNSIDDYVFEKSEEHEQKRKEDE